MRSRGCRSVAKQIVRALTQAATRVGKSLSVDADFSDFLDNLREATLDGPEPEGTGWIDPDFARELGLNPESE